MSKTLLLNSSYEPLAIIDVERAMTLYVSDKVEILHENENKRMRTIKASYPFPEVVRLKKYIPSKRKRMVLTKRNVYLRDNFTCQYCGSTKDLTIDHVIPISNGGLNVFENLVTCCHRCNNKKGSKSLEEAGLKLKEQPFHPSYLILFKTRMINSWMPYIYRHD